MARGERSLALTAAALALLLALPFALQPAGAGAPPLPAPPASHPVALAFDTGNATQLYPNASAFGSMGAYQPRTFKVFANRSQALPETLTLTLEATGALFGAGVMSVFDPEQMLLDERFTRNPGDINVSNLLVAETGFYLVVVESTQLFDWSVTVNWTVGSGSFVDNDNDLGNATRLAGTSGAANGSVTDWSDLVDTYALDLRTYGTTEDALLVNLTSPNIADLDLYLFHVEGGLGVVDGASLSPTGTESAAALATLNQTYYIRVLSYAGSSNYSFTWTVLNVSADDNGVPALATPLTSGSFANNLSWWDTRDLFRLDLTAGTTVNISLHTLGFNASSRTPDLQAVFWNATFSRVSWSFLFDPDERIDVVVPETGVYYLDIYGADPSYYITTRLSFDYTMNVSIDPPPALADPSWNETLPEDQVASVDLGAVIPPDPPGEPLVFALGATSGNITPSIGADGHTLTVVPAADWSGPAFVEVQVSDRFAQVTVRLPFLWTPVNDPPRFRAGAGALAFDEDGVGTLDLAAAVVDPEGGPVTLVSSLGEAPLSVVAVAGGLEVRAAANFHGVRNLTLEVADSLGAEANLTVVVTVRSVNDPPAFVGVPAPFVLNEDAPAVDATFNLTGLALDPDGDTVTYALTGLSSLSALIVGPSLSLYPAPDFWGDENAALTASDGTATATVTVLIRVLPVDDAPVLAVPPGQQIGHEGANFSLTLDAHDIDTPLSELRFSYWLDGSAEGTALQSRVFAHYFGYDDAGSHVLRVEVSDGNLTSSAEVAIFVLDTNRAPVAEVLSPRDSTFKAGEVVTFSGRASDPDGGPVNITWIVDGTAVSSLPTFSLDTLGPGRHTVELRVFDGELTATDATSVEIQSSLPGPGFAALAAALFAAALIARRARRP